jgi:hypothetical protein
MNLYAVSIGVAVCFATCCSLCGAAGALPEPQTTSLDGTWHLSVRHRAPGAAWSRPADQGQVGVPGAYLLWDEAPDQETALTLERPFSVPASWRDACAKGAHVLVEFDSVDYRASVEVAGSDGAYREIGGHEGYIGRFAVPLGETMEGTLRVNAWDLREGAGQKPESVARTTLQGVDPTAWGKNPCGILESVRLRLVGPVYMRNAYAATMTPGNPATVRLGAELLLLTKGPAEVSLRYVFLSPRQDTPLLQGSSKVTIDAGAPGRAVQVFEKVSVPGLPAVSGRPPEECRVRIEIERDGRVYDFRDVSLLNQRFSISGKSLERNGKPFFMKAGGSYFATRLPGVKEESSRKAAYFPSSPATEAQAKLVADGILAAGAEWIRFAHHVPGRRVHEAMRASGVMVYQDFPLLWRTDYRKLPQQEILRQFDEFLWRVAAEPAVGVIATHNEPEFENLGPARTTTQKLINSLIARAGEIAPHLMVIGASGGGGTATFPPDSAFPVNDPILDRHAYFASHWTFSFCGYRVIPNRVESLCSSDGRPIIWSEFSGGFLPQHQYLLGLNRKIDESDLPRRFQNKLVYRGRPFTVREAFAVLSAIENDGASRAEAIASAKKLALPENDPQLIKQAKDHFYADRATVHRPGDGDLNVWSKRVCAAWLAAQIYESRIQFHKGGGLCGTVPWDASADLGFPLSVEGLGNNTAQTVADVRGILAASYAPTAVYARPVESGQNLDFVIINDGPAIEGYLKAGKSILSRKVTVRAQSLARETLPRTAPEVSKLSGTVAVLSFSSGGRTLSRYPVVLP